MTTPTGRRFEIENGYLRFTVTHPSPDADRLAGIMLFSESVPTPAEQWMLDSWWLDGQLVIRRVGDYGCFATRRVKVCAAEW